jgi:hypothetical protein
VAKVEKATAPAPKPMSAAERAAADAERRRRLAANEVHRKEADRQAAEKQQAQIAADWKRAHARAAGHHEPEDPRANHGWGAIHAEIRARRGN